MKAPKHIAIIMDGNRRWSKAHQLPVWEGHRRALQGGIKKIVLAARELGVEHLTLFAWSTENWQRSPREIKFIFDFFCQIFAQEFQELLKKNVRVQIFGDIRPFPKKMRGLLEKAVRESQNNTGLTLNICLNYGGRAEIIDAIKKIIKDGKKPKDITEKLVGNYIYGGLDTPDPELIIRTSGEKRLSGFLTWRSVYSELFFLPKAWPDFKPADLKAVIKSFQQRERRFGK